ncbi:MAG: acyl-ACP thioesterase domain-containing protein [Acidimicrobiales bacterium]
MEFVPLGDRGRHFQKDYRVRLSDADEDGRLRLDGVARYLQDVGTDDWIETGVSSDVVWIVRRTSMRHVEGARWPRYLDDVTLTTWCGGVGAAWAERRTNFAFDGQLLLEVAALWVPTDVTGHPIRVRQNFFDVYGEACRERTISGRVTIPEIPDDATYRPWPLRATDYDIVGHVNNAAVWLAVSEVLATPLHYVSVTHHRALERDDDVTIAQAPGRLWLLVDEVVRVSVEYAAN